VVTVSRGRGLHRQIRDSCEPGEIGVEYADLMRATRLDDKALRAIAERYRRTPAQILIRWNLQRRTVLLPKANREEHLRENLDAFGFPIGAEDMETLERAQRALLGAGQAALRVTLSVSSPHGAAVFVTGVTTVGAAPGNSRVVTLYSCLSPVREAGGNLIINYCFYCI